MTACWFSTFNVRSDSNSSSSRNLDIKTSLMLCYTLRSDCAISSNDFKHLFDKVPSGQSVVSFATDCSSLAFREQYFTYSSTSSTIAIALLTDFRGSLTVRFLEGMLKAFTRTCNFPRNSAMPVNGLLISLTAPEPESVT